MVPVAECEGSTGLSEGEFLLDVAEGKVQVGNRESGELDV